ncbi:MAG: hypothetical protein WAM14_16885 [Candidatus Nitrosopolaris sp.]
MTEEKAHEIQLLKKQVTKMQESQLKIIDLLNYSNRKFPQNVLELCDKDTKDTMETRKMTICSRHATTGQGFFVAT